MIRFKQALSGFILATALLFGGAGAAQAQEFGLADFDGEVLQADGSPANRAGGHPFSAWTEFKLNTYEAPLGITPYGNLRDVEVDLPVGFAGNPSAMPKCTAAQFYADPSQTGRPGCPPSTQVGYVVFSAAGQATNRVPLFNMVAQPGTPAQLAFKAITSNVFLSAQVRTGSDYGLTIEAPDLSQGYAVNGTKVVLWGTPADPAHDAIRGSYCWIVPGMEPICFVEGGNPAGVPERPFLTNPTTCTGPVQTGIRVRSWTGEADSAAFASHDQFGNPLGLAGCDDVPFAPSFKASASELSAASPGGMRLEIGLPQSEAPSGLATSHLKGARVELPEGVSVNPGSADGLAVCTPAQVDLRGDGPAACPDASKVGSVRLETPVLENPLEGALYLASQRDNPFGSLLALYLVAEGSDVVVKVPGRVEADPATGRLTTSFDDNPQLPFSRLTVELFGGPRAPLRMPDACGTYTATAGFTPWSRPGERVQRSDSFRIERGPGGGPCPDGRFEPKLTAGTVNPLAGAYSPFALTLSRDDASQRLRGLSITLPPGLLGKLKGIPYCPDATLTGISGADGSGAAQLANPGCPAASKLGTVAVAAGAGSSPFQLDTGRAYLAGPYKGAPLSLAVVMPALAGPFDLGSVIVRSALRVDSTSAKITAVSDPLPTILHGIPLDLRELRVAIDRPEFTLNPTSCNAMAVNGSITSAAGQTANVADRFQVGACERLGFAPKLSLDLKGGTKRAKYPALKAVLKAKPGQANLGRVSVALPRSAFLAQEHIKTVCTRVQFAADACPAASVYGKATASTPLLDKPLSGPVYLRSSSNPLPDLVVALKGQIEIDLVGRIDSVNGGIRTTFDQVPDAPVTRFVLQMRGGKKGLLVNSRDLCKSTNRAQVLVDGQNGKAADQRPVLTNSCGGNSRRR
ncbi:MAG TPA: hypothetical protein VFX85_00135 [Solirubrobacterales bacterium]|nr:hypothetical protein [Solirubrobacterales bacterium]